METFGAATVGTLGRRERSAQFGEALQGERRTLRSSAVNRARMGLNTHHSKRSNKAVLATI